MVRAKVEAFELAYVLNHVSLANTDELTDRAGLWSEITIDH